MDTDLFLLISAGLMTGKDEGDQAGNAARSLSHMSLVSAPKLAPLSPKILGKFNSGLNTGCPLPRC